MTSSRGLIVEVDDGEIYALNADPDATELVGHRVTVEGVRNGFDRLDVEWIGEAVSQTELTRPCA